MKIFATRVWGFGPNEWPVITFAREGGVTVPVNRWVGRKVRYLRQAMNISQERLAERLGVPVSHVAEYEDGTRRISASGLYVVSQALEAPVAYFFDGYQA